MTLPTIVSSQKVLQTGDNVTTYTAAPFTVAGGSGHVLVILIQAWKNFNANAANTIVTANGSPVTNIVTTGSNAYAMGVIAVIEDPAAGDYTIAATLDGSGGRACVITCYELSGCDGIGASSISSSFTTSITTTGTDSRIIGGVSVRQTGTVTFTPASGVTEVVDASTGTNNTTDIAAFNGYMGAASPGSQTFGVASTGTPDNVNAYAIEVLAGGGSSGVSGAASGAIGLSGAASGAVAVAGTTTGSIDLSWSSTGAVALSGAVAGSIALSGSATASVAVSGAATGSIDLSGSASGTVASTPLEGVASGSIDLSGSASGAVAVAGAASGDIDLSGNASAVVSISGAASGSIGLSGGATGTAAQPARVGTASGSISFTGSSTGAVAIKGVTSSSLTLSGSATGSVSLPAISGDVSGTIPLGGFAYQRSGSSESRMWRPFMDSFAA